MYDNYYRVVAEVNLDAIAHNVKEIKKFSRNKSQLMAVVKADAYGHGVYDICSTLVENGVDWLAVAIIEEGIQLRKKGFKKPILILGYTPITMIKELIQCDLTQTVFTYDMAKAISSTAQQLNKVAKIHIKLDTGMGRIGFLCNENSLEQISKIAQLPNVRIEGIFTHFAKADEKDKKYTVLQINKFNSFVEQLEKKGVKIPIKHASNSAGIIDMPKAHFDLIRAGIILYGLYPSEDIKKENIKLKPAMTLKTHVIFVKEVEQGSAISYGGIYVTPSKKIIATIPVGYADGYSRLLSSRGGVLIKGKYAPIVGRICMDQFMVDVTDIGGVREGESVVLFGEQDGHSITPEDIANLIGTINYEIICMIGKRVPRVYIKDNKQVKIIDYFE